MKRLEQRQVLLLHQMLTEETGGDPGLRDAGLLDAALESAFATIDGAELYPTVCEKAARLGFSLIANHAIVDGNKRIGMLVMLVFLRLNGIELDTTSVELARVGLAVAAGEMRYNALLRWIEQMK